MTDLSKNWAGMSDPARNPQFRRLWKHPLQKRRRPARRARCDSPVAERPDSAAPKPVLVDRPPGLPRWPLLSLPVSGGGAMAMGRENRSGADRGSGGPQGIFPAGAPALATGGASAIGDPVDTAMPSEALPRTDLVGLRERTLTLDAFTH
jgi:hypothetical protein